MREERIRGLAIIGLAVGVMGLLAGAAVMNRRRLSHVELQPAARWAIAGLRSFSPSEALEHLRRL